MWNRSFGTKLIERNRSNPSNWEFESKINIKRKIKIENEIFKLELKSKFKIEIELNSRIKIKKFKIKKKKKKIKFEFEFEYEIGTNWKWIWNWKLFCTKSAVDASSTMNSKYWFHTDSTDCPEKKCKFFYTYNNDDQDSVMEKRQKNLQ